jgi:glycosyltransferase involved in cell wall biosynthesis
MDLLVVPSRQDNSPNVIGEALMSGVRVLGSNVGGIPELMMENGCSTVDATSPRNFANQILREMENTYSRLELATKASEKFSYKKIGTEVKKLYEEVL